MQIRWPKPESLCAGAIALAALSTAMPALAVGGLPNATPIADRVDGLYNLIFWITTVIFIGVWAAMAYVLIRFRFRPGREAKQFHGSTALEVVWTVLPTIALIVIAIPTYQTMRYVENVPKPDLTVEVVGHQWFWEYKLPDYQVDLSNQDLIVPANKVVKVLVSSVDVVHDWSVPEFGFKLDAIPGHINQGWFYAKAPGTYDGYCTQLCGTLHGRMLTHVKALSDADWKAWLASKGAKLVAAAPAEAAPVAGAVSTPAPTRVAAAPSQVDGKAAFEANCASCHQTMGQGMPNVFPPLAGSEFVNGSADEHIAIVLKGRSGPITVAGKQYNGAMPPFPQLSDEQIAALVSYERTAWGNHGGAVTPDQVKALRGK